MSTLSTPILFVKAFCNEQGIKSEDYEKMFVEYKELIIPLWNKYLEQYCFHKGGSNIETFKRYRFFISVNMRASND